MNTLYNNKYSILASTISPNPATVKYWADLASNPNSGDLKYFNGNEWVLVNAKATSDIEQIKEEITELENKKVDKVNGKDLSTNDYTTEEKNKLAELANYNDQELRDQWLELNNRISATDQNIIEINEQLNSFKADVEARLTALENA